jgi:hypothetical protein
MSLASESLEVTRIASADAQVVLDRLAGSGRLELGSVFLLSVEAIKERSGDRWPRKRDDVWGYLNRKLSEHLSYQDIHQRISETDFLVAMTTEEGVAAQAVGMKVLEEVLVFFLGSAERIDIRIRSVSSIEGNELSCVELDPEKIANAREQLADTYRRQVPPEQERQKNPISFVSANGQRLRVDFALEQVVSLRHGVTAVLRVEPRVTLSVTGEVIPARKFGRLADEDLAAVDRATLEFGSLFVPQNARTSPPVILPVSFRTMGSRKGRHMLSVIPDVTPERVRAGVLVELVDIGRGTPTGRLVEVVGLTNRLVRGVLGRLQPAKDALEPLHGARLNGLTLDVGDYPLADEQMEALFRAMAHQMRGKAPALIAQGLRSAALTSVADAAGFTHASLRGAPATADVRNVA